LNSTGNVFSSGHDLKEIDENIGNLHYQKNLFSECTEVMEAIRNLPLPVLATVNGLATAAGCQLVATCDMAIATSNSSFATPGNFF
jgi:enoyl-CoA hydratase/carnithine racemase